MFDPTEIIDPPVDDDLDVSVFATMPLNVNRLLQSDLYAKATPEEFKAALTLWCRAWHQIPAGSLPYDETALAYLSGAGRRWPKVREVALSGFKLAKNGRLFHEFLCELAVFSFANRRTKSLIAKAAADARWAHKKSKMKENQRQEPSERISASISERISGGISERNADPMPRREGKGRESIIGAQDSTDPRVPVAAAAPHAEIHNRLDVVMLACQQALGSAAPADFVIGPMVPIVEALGIDLVKTILAAEARRPRRRPIRSWKVWADIVTEEAENYRGKITVAAPATQIEPDPDGRTVSLPGSSTPVPWSRMRRYFAAYLETGAWDENRLGPVPKSRHCVLTPAIQAAMREELGFEPAAAPVTNPA